MNDILGKDRQWMRLGVTAVAAILAGASGNLYAQTDSSSARAPSAMEEITVTARKREETLQEAPVAISVLSADMIKDAGVDNMNGVGSRLPNVSSIDQPAGVNGNGFAPSIRGMSTNHRQIGAESSLGLFIDGAYAGNNANGNRFLPPVERVEFLPGPQATLFGKNTTIGVMNIVTKKPGDELEIVANAGAGNNGHVEYGGSVYSPLSDNWGIGLTLGKREYSGYVRNSNPPLDPAPVDDCFEEPVDPLAPPVPVPCAGNVWAGVLDGVTGPNMDSWGTVVQLAYRGDTTTFDLMMEYNDTERTHRPPAERVEGFDALPRDVVSTSVENNAMNDERAVTATFVRDFDNGGELTSITNWRRFHTDEDIDDDAYFYRVVEIYHWVTDQDQVSQELRYANTAGKMSYLVGAYWQEQDLYTWRTGDIWEVTPNLGVEGKMENETLAFFANADFEISDLWGAELGIRHGSETRNMPFFHHDISELGLWKGTLSDSQSSDKVSFTGALTFAPTDTLNTHLRFSRGHKSGGYGIEFITLDFEPPEDVWKFGGEQADSWELGFKWQATDALWLNTSLFSTEFEGLQVNQLISIPELKTPFFAIGNADEARTRGVEVTAIYQGDSLGLNASVGYNKAEFTRWMRPADLDDDGNTIFEDYSGREFSTPRKTAYLMANYLFDVGGRELKLIGEFQYRDGVPPSPGEDARLFTDSVTQINTRARYQINDSLSLTLWARNLTNERAVTSRGRNLQAGLIAGGAGWYVPEEVADGVNAPLTGQITGGYQAPRHWGLTLNYEFN